MDEGRSWLAVAAVAGVALGAGGGLLLRGDGGPTATPGAAARGAPVAPAADAALAREIDALRTELAAARDAGRARDEELARLRARVDALTGEVAEVAEGPEAPPAAAGGAPERPWFDAAKLLDAGIAPGEVARLRERFEEHQLELLYLRDEAVRDGQMHRFANERSNLEAALREELGPEDYDRLLYASGRPNRVMIQGLLSNSPASRAGIESGDVVLAYDGQRIFEARELKQATTAGVPGTQVALDLLRDGQELRIYVPRGPLGARLRPTRRPPID